MEGICCDPSQERSRRLGELEDIVAGLSRTLGACEADPEPLSGGITNRNYLVRLGGAEYVLRRHGRDTALLGIDRDAERQAGEAAAGLGIAPEVVAAIPGGSAISTESLGLFGLSLG